MKEILNSATVIMEDLMEAAHDIQEYCEDYIVKDIGQHIYMDDSANINFFDGSDWNTVEPSEWALGQASTKLGIPRGYLTSCIDAGLPGLAEENFNAWCERQQGNSVMLRTYDGGLRGWLSTKYTAYDTPEILEVLADNIPEQNWNIKGSYLNEERLHLRFVGTDELNVPKDSIFPAIFVDSSDVGRSALSVKFGLYRLVCTNGLVMGLMNLKYHQRHIGIKPSELTTTLQESLALLPEFVARSEDIIRYADSKSVRLDNVDEAEAILRELRVKAKLSEKDAVKVIDFAKEAYQPTRWGVINALTEFAQTKTLETRLELERAAGAMLTA